MFTIEQVNDIHDRLGEAETLLQYVHALNTLGVERYDSYLIDGHSEYSGKGGYIVKSPAVHEILPIAETSNKENLLAHLNLHEQGKTNHAEMSRGLAESGIEKWTVDTNTMMMTFYDKAGKPLLVEAIQ